MQFKHLLSIFFSIQRVSELNGRFLFKELHFRNLVSLLHPPSRALHVHEHLRLISLPKPLPISLPKNLPFRPPYCNHVIVVFLQTLLEQGRADANALGRNSCMPLHLAAEMDNENICKILVRAPCSSLLCC